MEWLGSPASVGLAMPAIGANMTVMNANLLHAKMVDCARIGLTLMCASVSVDGLGQCVMRVSTCIGFEMD